MVLLLHKQREATNENQMTILLTLEMTKTRPENMRVIIEGGLYLVQSLSNVTGNWLTLAEHGSEQIALIDCVKWY